MMPPVIGNGQIGMANTYTGGGFQPSSSLMQQGLMQGQGQRAPGQIGGMTPGSSLQMGSMPMNVQHPQAQLQPPKMPAPQQNSGGMEQALGGLQKLMGGIKGGMQGMQQAPSQGQTASSTPPGAPKPAAPPPPVHQPQMVLPGNPQTPGAAPTTSAMNPNPTASIGSAVPMAAPAPMMGGGDMGLGSTGGLLGNGFDAQYQGGNFDPNSFVDMPQAPTMPDFGMQNFGFFGLL